MQLANPIHRRVVTAKPAHLKPERIASPEAVAEVQAYIAIRDDLLAEAEERRTAAKIDSAAVANDFLIRCLRPARSPYEAQSLPDTDAARERKRCEFVTGRLAQLRMLGASAPQVCGSGI